MPAQACIWFEADPCHEQAVLQAFERMRAKLGADRGPAFLMRRPDLKQRDEGPRSTWMEVWTLPDPEHRQAFLTQLACLAQSSGAQGLACGERHVEIFEDLTPADDQPSTSRII